MTVSTTVNKTVFTADGINNTYTFTFAVPPSAAANILVFLTDTSGNLIPLTYGTQYTVTINAAIAPNPTSVGGQVTLTNTPSAGTLVTVYRRLSVTQSTSFANQGTLYQPTIESVDDIGVMLTQEQMEIATRAIRVPVSDAGPAALPPSTQRANLLMGFDSVGNPTAVSAGPNGVISSAMAPFCGAASIAAAKALLGYGSMANENIGAAGKGIADDGSGNARVNHTVTAVATNQSPGVQQHFTDYVASGTLIFTLPKLTTVFNGYELWVFCVSGTSTLSPNAADNFPSLGGGVSVAIRAGYFARLIGDGVSAWSITQGRIPSINVTTQTRQTFTAGSGTYTTPVGCTRIMIREVGGGGGGGGTTTSGGDGGATTFNSITANPGRGGDGAGNGAGGTAGAGTASLRVTGQAGTLGGVSTGGSSVFGGAGVVGATSAQSNAIANTGSGGCGGTAAHQGGGAGEYVEIIINNPSATYSYTVGTAGAAGTGVSAGGTGAAGQIIVDEYYTQG